MGYRFCLGASGAGKSTYLYREAVRAACKALETLDFRQNILIVVPDQFTMQTQKDLVLTAGSRGGIMNIDVLSFGRLSHRIFEEIGADTGGVLDDMGKSLILRRLAAACAKDLKVLGKKMSRPGMIAEVKSVLSEFMQYGISVDNVGELAAGALSRGQGALAARLTDLQVLYRAFLEERANRFLTGEETLDLLAEAIPKSHLIPRSIVIFDGFTGFTPVQYRAILSLMQCAQDVIISLDYAQDGGTPITDVMEGAPYEEQDLFYLTRQTVSQICRMGERCALAHGRDIWIAGGQAIAEPPASSQEKLSANCSGRGQRTSAASGGAVSGEDEAVPPRFVGNPALAHLEKSLFRNPVRVYEDKGPDPSAGPGGAASTAPEFGRGRSAAGATGKEAGRELPVHLILASNPGQEVRQMFIRIRKLIAEKGYHYRDFAVVTGDLASYEDEIRVCAERYDVPVYIDARRAVTQNPLTETIRSALEIGGGDYSYETVFRLLRGGLSGLSPDEVDRLDNYCLKRGIASRRRWESAFDPEYEPMRLAFLTAIRPLQAPRRGETVRAAGRNVSSDGGAAAAVPADGSVPSSLSGSDAAASTSGNGAEAAFGIGSTASAAASSGIGSTASAAESSGRQRTAQERTRALYEFLLGIRAGEQMQEKAHRLREQGLDAQAMEYGQIYGAVIHLLEELYDLPGQEPISAKDYLDLVTTGFQEIRIGTLPQQADCIPVGDMERTRLSEVKVLFVLGVNDGNIPKSASAGGLLSDLDREFLKESGIMRNAGISLAPTPREQMYIQRLYLYMNLTRPSQELYISYAAVDAGGRSIRPSYLIGLIEQMYPRLTTEVPEDAPVSEQMIAPRDASSFLAGALRDYADGRYLKDPAGRDEVLTLYGFCARQETAGGRYRAEGGRGELRTGGCPARTLREAAFCRYRAVPLSKETARQIYGRTIRGSVTRLESAAQCYMQQFLQYGLRLKERELYTFEASDSGTILHRSIQRFGQLLRVSGISWTAFTKEQGRTLIGRALREEAGEYNDQILYATARSEYQAGRLQRILERTVDTLQYQLLQGDFEPCALEQEFGEGGEFSWALRGGGRLTLHGTIDRVDLAWDGVGHDNAAPAGGPMDGTDAAGAAPYHSGGLLPEAAPAGESAAGGRPKTMASDEATTIYSIENGGERNIMYRSDLRHEFSDSLAGGSSGGRLYVKIVDYKSGKKDLDPVQMKAGLQLQLLLYMMAEVELLRRQRPGTEVVPAGMLYYRFDDPALDGADAEKVLAQAQQEEVLSALQGKATAVLPGDVSEQSGSIGNPGAGDITTGAQAQESAPPDSIREQEEAIIRRHLRPRGMVGAGDDILLRLDRSLAGVSTESSAVPVRRNRDGSLSKSSRTYTPEEYQDLTRTLRETVCRLAEDILDGRTDAAPVRTDEKHTACTWCAYKDSCGFDPRIPGYGYRDLKEL